MPVTITSVGEPEQIEFSDGKSMNKFPVELSDGSSGYAYRPLNNKWPPAVGDEGNLQGETFKKTPKEDGGGSGGGGGGGAPRSGGNSNPATDRKIIRQHAQKVAATIWNPADKWEEFVQLCDTLCEDVFKYGGAAPVPGVNAPAAAPQVSLDELKKQFQAGLANVGAALTDGVAAIGATYGREKLEVGDDIPKLVAKAKELADESVPF